VSERGRLVVLDEEVRVPREGVADDRDGEEQPQVERERGAEKDNGGDGPCGMQKPRPCFGMRADVVRPEPGEGADVVSFRRGPDFPTNLRGTSIAAGFITMAQDFDQFLKDVFGEPLSRLTSFSTDKMQQLTTKLQEMAREAVKEELTKLHTEVGDLRARVARLESERAQAAADSGVI
jgi:hypothetical protein